MQSYCLNLRYAIRRLADTYDNRYDELTNACDFINKGTYNDYVKWIRPTVDTKLSDFTEAACICFHSSLAVLKNGEYRKAETLIYEITNSADMVPIVVFSKGQVELQCDDDYLYLALPKDLFYKNLELFIKHYKETGTIDFSTLYQGKSLDSKPAFNVAEFGMPWTKVDDIDSFIKLKVTKHTDAILIDLNSNKELGLKIAFTIRLMVEELEQGALAKIILVYDKDFSELCSVNIYSQILMTQGCYLCTSEGANDNINTAQGLSVDAYTQGFLDRVYVKEDATYGHHSLANEWGLLALNRFVAENNDDISSILLKAKRKLFFRYAVLKSLGVQSFISPNTHPLSHRLIDNKPEGGKYLLIDDKSHEGWETVLKHCINGYAVFDSFAKEIASYDELPLNLQKKITQGYYDVIFLDLRLQSAEENREISPDKLSGMNILKEIKHANPGNQVIIFTASSKSWNLKALMDCGADEYYLKESPLFRFTEEESWGNANHLVQAIKECQWRDYHRESYKRIKDLETKCRAWSSRFSSSAKEEIIKQLEIALYLILRTRNVNDKDTFAYAFSALEFVFEFVVKALGVSGENMPAKIEAVIKRNKPTDNKELINNCIKMIRARNAYIHKNSNLHDTYQNIYKKEGFIKLLGVVEEFFGIFLLKTIKS